MHNSAPSPQAMLDELNETLEKGRVPLTPQIREYLESCLGTVQDKLQLGKPVTREDLVFIEKVKMWVTLPDKWREKYKTIEDMENSDEFLEANRRNISTQQWHDLLHMAEADGRSIEWIDETFRFENGKIIYNKDLIFENNISLNSLPSGLYIMRCLIFSNCHNIASLPSDIRIEDELAMFSCNGLMANKSKILPMLWDKLNRGEIGGLSLPSWPLEDGDIPDNLHVRKDLVLNDCADITSLPSGLNIGGSLDISGCSSLTSLPSDLHVGGQLKLSSCRGLKANKSKILPMLWDKLNKGEIGGLDLPDWFLKDGDIPDNLHVRKDLILNVGGYTKITSLPSGLNIGGILDIDEYTSLTSLPDDLTAEILQLSRNINPKVIQDAERLKSEGKIKNIIYS